MKVFKSQWGVIGLLSVFMLLGVSLPAAGQSGKPVVLPEMMSWSAFDVGSRGYVQGAAISDALTKQYKAKVRILPSGTSIGRVQPLKSGAATYGLLADEVFFALEGLYEFANPAWGPQDLRVVMAHPAPTGCVVTAKSGIKTLKDLKGKRVVYIPGASTNNVKAEGALLFAGLTWNDVERVVLPSYGAAMRGLIEGKIDAMANVGITAPTLYELENSNMGIHWPEFPPSDKEGWKRMNALCPWLSPGKCYVGPGIKKDQPKDLISYSYPQLTTYAKQDATEVYNLVKAFDQTFDMYKDVNSDMPDWAVSRAGRTPAGAPFHEGAIRYLKEKGIWTAEDDQWNNKFLARIKKVQELWKVTLQEVKSKGIAEKEFLEYWLNKRKEIKD
jgi:uncharacterized protein